MILVTAFVANAVTRDFELSTSELFFTKAIREGGFLLGRFLGASFVAFAVVLAAAGGLSVGALAFAIATLTRRMLLAYVGVVAFFVTSSLAGSLLADLDHEAAAALADPFGLDRERAHRGERGGPRAARAGGDRPAGAVHRSQSPRRRARGGRSRVIVGASLAALRHSEASADAAGV